MPVVDCVDPFAATIENPSLTTGTFIGVTANPVDEVDLAVFYMGIQWTGETVTYAFAETEADYPVGAYGNGELGSFSSLAEDGRDIMRKAAAAWDEVLAIGLTEMPGGTGEPDSGDVMIGASELLTTAWAYGPSVASVGGDIWVNTSQSFNAPFESNNGNFVGDYTYAVALHEFGHSLGLRHPHVARSFAEPDLLDLAYDSVEYTVMSYRSFVGDPSPGAWNIATGHYPQSPMMLDLKALQTLYGANYTTRSGDTVYRFSPDSGEMWVDGVSQGPVAANVIFRTLWDGGGEDTFDLSAYGTDIVADLTPGSAIVLDAVGGAQRARLGLVDNSWILAGGNIYMSLLHEGDTRSLIENVTTGTGDDLIIGNTADNIIAPGLGHNVINGGAGQDTVALAFAASAVSVSLTDDGGLLLSHEGGSAHLTAIETVQTTTETFGTAWLAGQITEYGYGAPMALSQMGVIQQASIRGTVYADTDGSRAIDAATDTPVAGVTVYLDGNGNGIFDAGEIGTTTAADGSYAFTGLSSGSFSVALVPDGDGLAPRPLTGDSETVVLTSDSDTATEVDFLLAASETFAEFGTMSGMNHTWQTVSLSHRFDDPVVFVTSTNDENADTVSVRLREIGSGSFQLALQEPEDLDGIIAPETVSYAVMERGQWVLADGRLVEIGTLETNLLTPQGFETVVFASDFDSRPTVFSDRQTSTGLDFTTTRHDAITSDSFRFAMEEEEKKIDSGHAMETVGWLAIEAGVSTQDGTVLETLSVSNTTHQARSFALAGPHGDGIGALADLATFYGPDPARANVTQLGTTGGKIHVLEDRSRDTETNHIAETLDILAFSGSGLMSATAIDDLLFV